MKRHVKTSKFLSLVLRHRPEAIGIELDDAGWVDIDELLEACKAAGRNISREELEEVVATNDKQRFAICDGRIRANQGHSLDVDLRLSSVVPPELLYHGTARRFVESIRREGLRRRTRHHVHLSPDIETAEKVGRRHGKPVVLIIDSAAMHQAGHGFYVSENGVWLTESVPPEFIRSK